MFLNRYLYLLLIISFAACNTHTDTVPEVRTPDQKIAANIAELKSTAANGDLVVRLTDDLISERIRYLNEADFSYSHSGLIIEQNGVKYVCHIETDDHYADTIQMVAIDSFLNPAKNISCALYRYNLSAPEKDSLQAIIETYRKNDVRFDRVFDLATNDKMYCSEMIARALQGATNNRIVCREVNVPPRMRKAVASFFKKQKMTPETVASRKIITVDNLYRRNDCSLIMKFPLKYFPDQL